VAGQQLNPALLKVQQHRIGRLPREQPERVLLADALQVVTEVTELRAQDFGTGVIFTDIDKPLLGAKRGVTGVVRRPFGKAGDGGKVVVEDVTELFAGLLLARHYRVKHHLEDASQLGDLAVAALATNHGQGAHIALELMEGGRMACLEHGLPLVGYMRDRIPYRLRRQPSLHGFPLSASLLPNKPHHGPSDCALAQHG